MFAVLVHETNIDLRCLLPPSLNVFKASHPYFPTDHTSVRILTEWYSPRLKSLQVHYCKNVKNLSGAFFSPLHTPICMYCGPVGTAASIWTERNRNSQRVRFRGEAICNSASVCWLVSHVKTPLQSPEDQLSRCSYLSPCHWP